ncbi:MAG: sensor histidine kinase [Acidobacteriota bacterium]
MPAHKDRPATPQLPGRTPAEHALPGTPPLPETDRELIAALQAREKALRAALQEKEVLLREIHHRVKNNIQIIVSLLRLQANSYKDKGLREALKDSQSRIRSISLIHEKLYQSSDLAAIDFGDYIRLLAGQLFHLFGTDPSAVRLEVKASGVRLETKKAVPCGLILNELITNALKYAFPQGRKGVIRVEMRAKGGHYSLSVSDNGIGLPEEADPVKPQRLGFQIVSDLVRQLGGSMTVERVHGTVFHITF